MRHHSSHSVVHPSSVATRRGSGRAAAPEAALPLHAARPDFYTRRRANRSSSAVHARAGATVVESAIALSLMFSVLFTLFDLGLMAFQSNMLSLAARRLARETIVRGSAIDSSAAWGPTPVAINAADSSAIGQVVNPYCVTMTPSKVNVQVTWLDGTNRLDDRITTHLTFTRDPLSPLTAWLGPINLSANATMRIVH